jgi:hypothetical protein
MHPRAAVRQLLLSAYLAAAIHLLHAPFSLTADRHLDEDLAKVVHAASDSARNALNLAGTAGHDG